MSRASKARRAKQRQRKLAHSQRCAAAVARPARSQQPAQAALRWHEPQADELEALEQFDGFAPLRNGLRRIAGGIAEYAGIPMPLEGERLVIEPSYARGNLLAAIGAPPEPEPLPDGVRRRNSFWSRRHGVEITIWQEADGAIKWGRSSAANHIGMDLHTLGCADAWGIEQEGNAVRTLAGLLRHRQFKQYMLTSMFLERSQRSGITYLFRRLKPTVAINTRGEETRVMCTLCLHPIAYYAGTWAGAMTPTDDVIGHLMLMRGDEKMFWRRANQHAAHRPESGL